MKIAVNLIPLPALKKYECLRLLRRWSSMWLIAVLCLVAGYLFTCQAVKRAEMNLAAAQSTTSKILQAQNRVQALVAETQKLRQSVEFAQRLEQSNVPLALLQTVAQCCQQVQPAARLSSLRMSEFTTVGISPSKNSKPDQPASAPSKQLLMTGVAQADACLNLVSALRATGIFQTVELMNSQSTSELKLAEQSFQIRCEQ